MSYTFTSGRFSYLLRGFGILLIAPVLAATPAGATLQSPPPSLQDFSLEPDEDPAEEPPSRVQGPVADGQRPRDLSQPAQQPQTAPQTQPQPQQSAPRNGTAPATVQPAPRTQRPSPQVSQQQPAQTQPSETLQAQDSAPVTRDNPVTTDNDASDGIAADTGANEAAETPAATEPAETAPQLDLPAPVAGDSEPSSSLWLWIVLALAAAGAAVFMLLRRRSAAAANAGYQSTDRTAREPLSPSPPVNLGEDAKVVPQPKSAPVPTPKPVPAPQPASAPPSRPNDGGFIISSLKAAPQPSPAAPAPAPARPAQPGAAYTPAPAASNSVGDMRVEFVAESAGSTMMNAVLGYNIRLHNEGGGEMSNVALHGTMVQASGGGAPETDLQMQPLHKVGVIAAGSAHDVKGDIRVPLAGIEPIEFNNQALFVPVAHFLLEYDDADGKTHREHHAFIIGREHQPPREKMAPFRLDQGPGNFRPVGQRVLAV